MTVLLTRTKKIYLLTFKDENFGGFFMTGSDILGAMLRERRVFDRSHAERQFDFNKKKMKISLFR